MSVPQDQHNRIVAQARVREGQGYFARAAAGDQRAASLFVRLVAYDLNPAGLGSDVGWLRKGGGTNVDGYAEDAVCGNANSADLFNVIDMVGGTGAPGARLNDANPGNVKERRSVDTWFAPRPLTTEELTYLLSGGTVPVPPTEPVQPYPDERTWWPQVFDVEVAKRYTQAGKVYPDGPAAFRWASRTSYDIRAGLTKEESLAKHLKELEQELGL